MNLARPVRWGKEIPWRWYGTVARNEAQVRIWVLMTKAFTCNSSVKLHAEGNGRSQKDLKQE